jgi:hypothetical protein
MFHVSKRVGGGTNNSWLLASDPVGGDPRTAGIATYAAISGMQYAISALNVINLGTWHHVAATFEGITGTARVYVDGAQETSVGGNSPITYDTGDVNIGCDNSGPAVGYFVGALDELQIYDRALSAAEIAQLASR